MTGTGVNDVPAIERADVGIAVHGATDAAMAAADIVLTEPGLSKIVEGILISRRIWCRIRNFLTYRIAATLQLVTFFFIAVFAFRPDEYMPGNWKNKDDFPDSQEWPPFFRMPVLMLILITLINDGALITIGYDNALASEMPPIWNIPFLFAVGAVQACVAVTSSLLLLFLLLDSWTDGSLLQYIGVGGLSYGKITTAIYLKVSVSDFLSLFSARTGGEWAWAVCPADTLLAGAVCAFASSTLIALFWPRSNPDGVPTTGLLEDPPYSLVGWVWCWSLGWWVVEDAAKVCFHWFAARHNIFDVNKTGEVVMSEAVVKLHQHISDHSEGAAIESVAAGRARH